MGSYPHGTSWCHFIPPSPSLTGITLAAKPVIAKTWAGTSPSNRSYSPNTNVNLPRPSVTPGPTAHPYATPIGGANLCPNTHPNPVSNDGPSRKPLVLTGETPKPWSGKPLWGSNHLGQSATAKPRESRLVRGLAEPTFS